MIYFETKEYEKKNNFNPQIIAGFAVDYIVLAVIGCYLIPS